MDLTFLPGEAGLNPSLIYLGYGEGFEKWVRLVFGSGTFDVIRVNTSEEVEQRLTGGCPGVVVCGLDTSRAASLETLAYLKRRYPGVPRLIYTDDADPNLLFRCLNEGGVYRWISPRRRADLNEAAVRDAVSEFRRCRAVDVVRREQQVAIEQLQSLPYICTRFRNAVGDLACNFWRFLLLSAAFVLICGFLALAVGFIALAFLYMLKSLLGIDVFRGLHLEQVLERILP